MTASTVVAADGVDVPPVGAVGEEVERAVGGPDRLDDRLARPAGDDRRIAELDAVVADVEGATHSSVESHGMFGWSHWIHARRLPSGEIRGLATKSGPVTSTAGSPPRRPGRRRSR